MIALTLMLAASGMSSASPNDGPEVVPIEVPEVVPNDGPEVVPIDSPEAVSTTEPLVLEPHTFTVAKLLPFGSYVHSDDPPCASPQLEPASAQSLVNKAAAMAQSKGVDPRSSAGSMNDYLAEGDYIVPPLRLPFGEIDNSACIALLALIPVDAEKVTVQYSYTENSGTHNCSPDADCAWGKFSQLSDLRDSSSRYRVLVTRFKNWSGDRNRVPKMTINFLLPRGRDVNAISIGSM